MSKKQIQNGFSRTLVIIIILSIALVCTLGFILWQNFAQSKSDNKKAEVSRSTSLVSNNTENNEAVAKSDVKEPMLEVSDTAKNTGLTIKYPSSWSVSHVPGDSVEKAESYAITSPDKLLTVHFFIGLNGVGGACDSDDINYVVAQAEYDSIPGLSSYVRYMEAITHNKSNGLYYYESGTQALGSYANHSPVVGGQACSVGMIGPFTYKGSYHTVAIGLNNIDLPTSNLKAITDIINSETYATARNIVESLYVK